MKRKIVQLVKLDVEGLLVDAKECTKCNTVKSLDEYHRKSNGLGKRSSSCKKCTKEHQDSRREIKSEYDKKYREANKDRLREVSRIWRQENKEYVRQRKEEYYQNNKERHRELSKKWAEDNRERYLELQRKSSARYRERNPDYVERCLQAKKEHYHQNKEEYAKRWKIYSEENKDEIRKRQKEFYTANREHVLKLGQKYYRTPKGQIASMRSRHRRRAAEKESLDTLTSEQWKSAKKHFGFSCAYCGEKEELTVDHFVPVSKGGDLTVKNAIPSCQSCNSSKRDNSFAVWYPMQDFYDEEKESKILQYLGYKDSKQQMAFF